MAPFCLSVSLLNICYKTLALIVIPIVWLFDTLICKKPKRADTMLRRHFNRKRCIVTGGASGIGLAVVCELRKYGAIVLAVDVNRNALQKLQDLSHANLFTQSIDLTEEDAPIRILNCAVDRMGGVDFLLNNAGVLTLGPFLEHSDRQLRGLMEINLLAPIRLTRQILKYMLENNKDATHLGDIGFIASLSSWSYVPSITAYDATKGGIKNFARALSREVSSKGIHISSVYPFVVRTNIAPKKYLENIPIFSSSTPSEVAHEILWGVATKKKDIYVHFLDRVCGFVDKMFPSLMDQLLPLLPIVDKNVIISEGTVGFGADSEISDVTTD